MLLNAVIIILREVLEASLLVSLLLVIALHFKLGKGWLFAALTAGLIGAVSLALNLQVVSEWFEYTGQERLDAAMLLVIFILLLLIVNLAMLATEQHIIKPAWRLSLQSCMALVLSFAIIREGAEIYIYLSSFVNHPQQIGTVYVGSLIGAAIGASAGALFFYSIAAIKQPLQLFIATGLSGLLAAAAASQIVPLLEQVDLLNAGPILWNTSNIIDEQSVLGQLLYAIAGYESSPSTLQASVYLGGLLLALVGLLVGVLKLRHRQLQTSLSVNANG